MPRDKVDHSSHRVLLVLPLHVIGSQAVNESLNFRGVGVNGLFLPRSSIDHPCTA